MKYAYQVIAHDDQNVGGDLYKSSTRAAAALVKAVKGPVYLHLNKRGGVVTYAKPTAQSARPIARDVRLGALVTGLDPDGNAVTLTRKLLR